MNISVKGEYALHALLDLARTSGQQPVKIAEIARRQNIPQKFLELILASLKQGGFVQSRRGADGGYLLARPADSITVGDVVRHIEGRSKMHGNGSSPFSEMWRDVDVAVDAILSSTTFAALARNWTDKQGRFVPNWEI